jgi:hypothetical protein
VTPLPFQSHGLEHFSPILQSSPSYPFPIDALSPSYHSDTSVTKTMAAAVEAPINSASRPHITILKRTRADLPLSQTKFLKKTAKGKVLNCMYDPHLVLSVAHTQSCASATSAMISHAATRNAICAPTSPASSQFSPRSGSKAIPSTRPKRGIGLSSIPI